jgi:acyl-CoA thioester hydrolase
MPSHQAISTTHTKRRMRPGKEVTMDAYSMTYDIRWADLDANGHVHYSAFIDAAAELRYRFFTDHGFSPDEYLKLGIGAVYSSIEAHFLREVRVGETITIVFTLAGLSPKGTRWKVHHDILKANGKKAVVLDIEGAILDLTSRRLATATPELLAVFHQIPRSLTFEALPEGRSIG